MGKTVCDSERSGSPQSAKTHGMSQNKSVWKVDSRDMRGNGEYQEGGPQGL